MSTIILGIESSCDDTAAAVLNEGKILANLVANQDVHKKYGGVVPELAARAHQQNIIPVVANAFEEAGIQSTEIDAVAFTRGPGLIGPLLVGTSFAKAFALSLNIPIIEVNHMQAHVHALLIKEKDGSGRIPAFPFLCMTVSGGHTQILKVNGELNMDVLGETLDDAAGEAFDKTAKILDLPYPGGALIDKFASDGNPDKFKLPEPRVPGLDFSFSGLKTAILYLVQDETAKDANFVKKNLHDLCASVQKRIVTILMNKLVQASEETSIAEVAIAGGVSANSGLRTLLNDTGQAKGWNTYIPKMEYCTDNGAMIAMTGYIKYKVGDFAGQEVSAVARYKI